jgi:hypothetical membrane protein
VLILGSGATAFGAHFRLDSIVTLVAVLGFGALAGFIAATAQSAVSQSAPWLGVAERLNIYSFLLWVVVLAIGPGRSRPTVTPVEEARPTAATRA